VKAVRLPFTFDPTRLKADLAQIRSDDWVSHFNKPYYEGEWSGVALRSTNGEAGQIYPDPTKAEYVDTPALTKTSYFVRCFPVSNARSWRHAFCV
jgi:hypothetical protein